MSAFTAPSHILAHVSKVRLFEELSSSLSIAFPPPPEDAPDDVRERWMLLADVDGRVAGWLSYAAASVTYDSEVARAAHCELSDHPEWREVAADRYDLLLEASKALASG
jgi:hypothetical protein